MINDDVPPVLRVLSEDHYRLLGRVVAAGALLEVTIESMICQLVEPGRQVGSVLTITQGEAVGWLLERVRQLASENIDESDRERWIEWAVEAKRALEERNAIVHVAWMLGLNPSEALGVRRRRRGPDARAGTVPEFRAIRDRLVRSHADALRLIASIRPSVEGPIHEGDALRSVS